jgi:uncharacterized MAPEG superfamily protein
MAAAIIGFGSLAVCAAVIVTLVYVARFCANNDVVGLLRECVRHEAARLRRHSTMANVATCCVFITALTAWMIAVISEHVYGGSAHLLLVVAIAALITRITALPRGDETAPAKRRETAHVA